MVKTSHAGRRDPDLWERSINSHWDGEQPILSGDESIVAARKLYRHAMGKPWPGEIKLTSGNRYTWAKTEGRWVRKGGLGRTVSVRVLWVNPDRNRGGVRGLRALIHDLSHYCHRRLHPGESDHSRRQAALEAKMVRFAIQRNWHRGALARPAKPEKPKPDLIAQRHRKMVARRDRWAKALERARRLHQKAQREVAAYERRHRDRLKLG